MRRSTSTSVVKSEHIQHIPTVDAKKIGIFYSPFAVRNAHVPALDCRRCEDYHQHIRRDCRAGTNACTHGETKNSADAEEAEDPEELACKPGKSERKFKARAVVV